MSKFPFRRALGTGVLALLAVSVTIPGAAATTRPITGVDSVLTSPAGGLAAGPRNNGTGVLPDGRLVTPAGRAVKVDLEPLNSFLSRDGRRLYVSSEGIDDAPPAVTDHDHTPHARFITVIDTKTLAKSRIRDDALHYGLAESADGRTLYVSEGQTDSVGVFDRTPANGGGVGTFRKRESWALHPSSPVDYPWGLALSPDGSKLFVAGFSGNTLTEVSTATGRVLAQVPTGAYPYGVVISPDGRRVYVSNWGLYNADVAIKRSAPIATPPTTIGGYNTDESSSVWTYDVSGGTPMPVVKTRIGRDLDGASVIGGSLPSGIALSPDGRRLAVTASNDDLVALLDTTKSALPVSAEGATVSPTDSIAPAHPSRLIDMRVLPGSPSLPAPTGAQPDAPAWSPDGRRLYIGEGERNDVAVIDVARVGPGSSLPNPPGSGPGPNRNAVIARIPTAWYPTSVRPSSDGRHLFVTTLKGLGAGPNTNLGPAHPASQAGASAPAYIPNTIFGQVNDVDLGAHPDLVKWTRISDANDGLVPARSGRGTDAGDGAVIPTHFGAAPSDKIKHVFLIIKENRPFDQVFGDMPNVERDNNFTAYGQFITPNAHALAGRFALGDNYYATTETSTQGHYAVDTGQVNEFVDKITPSSYAGKLPYGAFDTTPENLPEGGFIWDNAARHGVTASVFGEGTFVVGVAPALLGRSPTLNGVRQLVPGVQRAAGVTYDPLYPSQVNLGASTGPARPVVNTVFPFNDEGRADAFQHALGAGAISSLNVLLLFDDHTDGDIAGKPTPERQVAENDHALGRVVDMLSHSPVWKDSAVFVTEDDTQGGQDHVDAYRTFGLVASPWARTGYVSHRHQSFASMTKTIDLILGLPPTSLQELTATSLADDFIGAGARPDLRPFDVAPNNTQPATNRTVADSRNPLERAAAELALSIPPGIDRGGDLLPEDLALARAGSLLAGDPNVKPNADVVQHTLQSGSPKPIG